MEKSSKNLPEHVVQYLKLKAKREQLNKAVRAYYERKKQSGEPIKKKTKYHQDNDLAYRYKENAILAVKRLFGNCHLI